MAERAAISRFSPNRTDAETLERIFVQREAIARDIIERVVAGANGGGNPQLLFVGPRGSGKTHLVTLVVRRLERRDDLRDRLRIAWLAEDETTTSFAKLLLRIHRALAQSDPAEFPPPDPAPLKALDEPGRARLLGRRLVDRLAGRTLLIAVENLDVVLGGLKKEGQSGLRAFLQENPVAAILATAQQLTPDVSSRKQPFYGFFTIDHLRPLTVEEARFLLKKIAEEDDAKKDLVAFLDTPTGRARVRAFDHLAGGNHRVYIVLSDLLTRDSLDELVGPFEKMVDELTPYYQERLRSVSPQQGEIVEFLCRSRFATSVQAIADELFISNQTAASQLKILHGLGYVRKAEVGRESRYELAEPLMRIWVEVKENRGEPIRLFVDFLRIWYTRDQLERRLADLPPHARLERQYVEHTLRAIQERPPDLPTDIPDFEQWLETDPDAALSDLERWAAGANTAEGWLLLSFHRNESKHFELGLSASDRALGIDPQYVAAWNNRGYSLDGLDRHEEAVASYDRALEIDPRYAVAWYNRGYSLDGLGRHEEAVASYDRALEIDPEDFDAWYNCGNDLISMGRWARGIESLERGLRCPQPPSSPIRSVCSDFIENVLNSTRDPAVWTERVRTIVGLFVEARPMALPTLGIALVETLGKLPGAMLNDEALAGWDAAWQDSGDGHEALRFPLRLFGVGLSYVRTKDRRVLLDLISEERSIVEQALGLAAPDAP